MYVLAIGLLGYGGFILLTGGFGLPSNQVNTKSDSSIVQQKLATNPKKGWVDVFKDLSAGENSTISRLVKRCDGTTLIYQSYAYAYASASISTIPNSPECGYKE